MKEELNKLKIYPQIKVTYNQYREGLFDEVEAIEFIQNLLKIKGSELDAQKIFNYFRDEENKVVVLDIIKKEKPKKWVSNFDARRTNQDRDKSLFDQYQRILISEGKEELAYKLKKEVYQILDATPKPEAGIGWKHKGLVFGKVQSGKTSNFIGLIAKAIDVGYDFVIVLAGIPEDLRQQTQERIDKYIFRRELSTVGNDYVWLSDESEASKALNLNPLTYAADKEGNSRREGEFKRKVEKTGNVNNYGPGIMIVKKNVSILQNEILPFLVKECDEKPDSSDRKINTKTCLIIDDECDNASVLGQSQQEYLTGEEKKAINLNIRRIINLFNRVTYVGYTATPQNVVMQSRESTAKEDSINYKDRSIAYKIDKDLTLFPEDFIQILEPSEGYLGLDEFLDESKKYIEIIDDQYLPETKEEEYVINKPLVDACLHFISCIYIRKHIWKEENINNSMLLHPSSLKSNLEKLKDVIESFKASLVGDANRGQLNSKYFQLFKGKVLEYRHCEVSFDDYIEIIENVEVVSVHSGKEATTLNFRIIRDRIIVGGNKLSRGFTVEGLSVSYFFRKSSRLDSLHQMARWFGYRGKMNDIIKVYLTKEDKNYFEFLQSLDSNLMEQIYFMNFEEMDPYNFRLSLLYDPDLLGYDRDTKRRMDITDPNKQRNFEKGSNFSRPIILRNLLNNLSVNQSNVNETVKWISDLQKSYEPYCLNINEENRLFERSDCINNGGRVYFTGIPFERIIGLYDSLSFFEQSQVSIDSKYFFESNRNKLDPSLQNWSVMISRKEHGQEEFSPPFFINRTYELEKDSDNVYVSSVEDSKNLQEDIFDLIKNQKEYEQFLLRTTGINKLQELNKMRKEKGINLLKIYFTRANNSKVKDQSIKVDEAVILGFKFPSQKVSLTRK
jgi:hypothetical protein